MAGTNLRAGSLVFFLFSVLAFVACVRTENASPAASPNHPPPVVSSSEEAAPTISVTWFYRDNQRVSWEIIVENYPVPAGFSISCPITEIRIELPDGSAFPVYFDLEAVTLDSFYAATHNSRWLCTSKNEKPGKYRFSLMYFDEEKRIPISKQFQTILMLGSVYASNGTSQILLPARGEYPLASGTGDIRQVLTWNFAAPFAGSNQPVQINRVALNPSFALVEACITYDDQHYWKPNAILKIDGKIFHDTAYTPTYPFPYDLETTIKNAKRCYALILPHSLNIHSFSSFQAGIENFVIQMNDSNTLTMAECNAAKSRLSNQSLPVEIRCYSFQLRGEAQTWFDILRFPEAIKREVAYAIVEGLLTRTIQGPWLVEIEP